MVLAAAVVLLAAAGCSDDGGDKIMRVGTDAVGTCLKFDESVGAEISEWPEVPCDEEHSHEVFAVVVSPASVYPGFEALEEYAQAQCLARFEDFVGISAFDSTLFYSWLVPTLSSWDREKDREIICVLGDADAGPLTESMRDSKR